MGQHDFAVKVHSWQRPIRGVLPPFPPGVVPFVLYTCRAITKNMVVELNRVSNFAPVIV